MTEQSNKRSHPRFPSAGKIRIYTSIVNTPYTVDLRDVSRSGFFIRTMHLPVPGEQVTYNFIDKAGRKVNSGQGKVVRLVTKGRDCDIGFAMEFESLLKRSTLKKLSIS